MSTYLMALPDFYDGRMKTTCFPCLETGRSVKQPAQEPPIRQTVQVSEKMARRNRSH